MLRITERGRTPREIVLAVDGRVVDHGSVRLLAREIECARSAPQDLVLDLDGLQFIDDEGLALLQQLTPPLRLRGGSAFVRALLAGKGLVASGAL